MQKQESLWKQNLHDNRIQLGDRNSKFFHHRFHTKRRRNKILMLQNESGKYKDKNEDIAEIFFYSWNLVMTTNGTRDYSFCC